MDHELSFCNATRSQPIKNVSNLNQREVWHWLKTIFYELKKVDEQGMY